MSNDQRRINHGCLNSDTPLLVQFAPLMTNDRGITGILAPCVNDTGLEQRTAEQLGTATKYQKAEAVKITGVSYTSQ
jgi:hypothetical protein